MDFITGSPVETTNTDLVSCLTALGIPLVKETPCRRLVGDINRISWFLQATSLCGKFHTRELVLAWDDPTWHERNPEHPFAYMMMAFRNKPRLRAYIREGTPTYATRRGDKIAFVSVDAPDAIQRLVEKELRKR